MGNSEGYALALTIVTLLFAYKYATKKGQGRVETCDSRLDDILATVSKAMKIGFIEFTDRHNTVILLGTPQLSVTYHRSVGVDSILTTAQLEGELYREGLFLTFSEDEQVLVDNLTGEAVAITTKVGLLKAIIVEIKKRAEEALLERN